jgi:hypothetical protein
MRKMTVYNPNLQEYIGKNVTLSNGSRGLLIKIGAIFYLVHNTYKNVLTSTRFNSLTYYKDLSEGRALPPYKEPRPSRYTLAKLRRRVRKVLPE